MEKREELKHKILLTFGVVALCGIILLLVLRFSDNSLAKFSYSEWGEGITIDGYSGDSATIEIPEEIDGKTVVALSENSFTGQKKLKKILLPETVTEIGATAFADCENLSVVKASGVTVIRADAFEGCGNLKEIELSPSLAVIEDGAFHGCGKLRSLPAPATLTEIGIDALAGCGNLRLDCSQNALAAEVAAQYGISTDGSDTSRGMWLRVGGATLLLGGAVAIVWFALSKTKSKKAVREKTTE